MLKSAIASFLLIGALVASVIVEGRTLADPKTVAQTGTAIDTFQPAPCSETQCATYVSVAIDREWKRAAAAVDASLAKCKRFTPRDRLILAEKEKKQTERERYLLRLAVLTQLAEH